MTAKRDLGGIVFVTLAPHILNDSMRCVAVREECREVLRKARIGDHLRVYGMYTTDSHDGVTPEVHIDEITMHTADEKGSASIATQATDSPTDGVFSALSAYKPRDCDISFYDYLDEAEVRSHLRLLGADPCARGLSGLRPAIQAYGMSYDAAEGLTEALPTLKMLAAAGKQECYFRDLWKLLSSDTVSETIEARGVAAYALLASSGVVTHHEQLRHIDANALDRAKSHNDDVSRSVLRRLLAHCGGQFSNVLELIAGEPELIHRYDLLIAATKSRMTSPTLFALFKKESRVTEALARRLRLWSFKLFAGTEPEKVASEAAHALDISADRKRDLLLEILYWSHRPPNHSFASFVRVATRLLTEPPRPTCIRTQWSRTKAVLLRAGRTHLSPLSRVAAGICTAAHANLDERPDHAHIDMFDLRTCRVAGNVQLYQCVVEGRQVLALRGINPSVELIQRHGVASLVAEVFAFASTVAANSGFKALTIIEPLGVLNVETARKDVRAMLSWAIPTWKRVRFMNPVELFELCGRTIAAVEGFEICSD